MTARDAVTGQYVPEYVYAHGAVYRMHTRPEKNVQLNVTVECRTREQVRTRAVREGTDMGTVVNDALAAYLAA